MYLQNAIIEPRKLGAYLLDLDHPQGMGKCIYLMRAGFRPEEPEVLEQALLRLVASVEAVYDGEDNGRCFYSVTGPIYGPINVVGAKTIWEMNNDEPRLYDFRFVTLKPKQRWK